MYIWHWRHIYTLYASEKKRVSFDLEGSITEGDHDAPLGAVPQKALTVEKGLASELTSYFVAVLIYK